jgi:glycosyltransferase involved in cell wall biosynthesis
MGASFISIVTPSLNRARFVREAVASVLAQDYAAFEHIISDGASSDGTLEVLRDYPHLRVVSEADSGMYEAINRGLELARGEIIGLLNTDDLYAPGAFGAVVSVFDEHPEALAVVGGASIFADAPGGRGIVREDTAISPGDFWYRVIRGHPVTNAWFWRREVFTRIGLMDPSYHFAGDREFLIRAALAGVRPAIVPMTLYQYRQHPESVTISGEDSRQPRRGAQRLLVLGEDIRLQEGFLDRQSIPPEAYRELKTAHSTACSKAAVTAFYHRRFRLALWAARHGFRYNSLWAVILVRNLWHRILQEFGLRETA